jgi:hypothetical protein
MSVDYYILKEGINQKVLEEYGYIRWNEDQHYIKEIMFGDEYVRIAVHRLTGRINFGGRYYMIKEEYCIKDLIEAGLVNAVELDYSDRPIMEDPDEFEDDVEIGLGKEMIGE